MATERDITPNAVPHVTARPMTIYGDATQEAIDRPDVSMFDLPGITEKRRDLELARAYGRPVNGTDPRETLPHRFQFVRKANEASGMSGREGEWRSKGYDVVKWEEAAQYGFSPDESLGHIKGPDGTIRVGDTVLMAAPADVAAANLIRHERKTSASANAHFAQLQDRAARMGTEAKLTEDEPRDDAQ